MNSIAIIEAVNTTSLPFHGKQIITAMAAGVAYVAMKPIVENIGLDWASQFVKLNKQRDKFNCCDITMVAGDSKLRQLMCIPLKKLNGWLFSINPAKVRDDIRDRLVRYQEECFTALHDYWTKGAAIRKPETTVDDRTPLRGIVNRIMGKYGLTYQAVYKLIHKEFDVKHIDELSAKQTSEAIEYLASKVIEGEFIGRDVRLPSSTGLDINIPLEWWFEHNSPLREGNPKAFGPKRPFESESLTISPDMLFGESAASPTLHLTAQMESAGHDLSACRSEVITMRKIIQKLWPVVREVDAIRGSRQARFVRLVGKKGEILMG